MPAPKKTVAVSNEQSATMTGLALSDERPDWIDPHSHKGSEDVTSQDITLPRIEVLQALSPQLKKSEPNYIEGSEQGQIFNTISGEIYGSEVTIVSILFQRQFIIWQDRNKGGGFAGMYPTELEAEQEREAMDNADDYDVVEHHINFCLVLRPNGHTEEAVLSWAKSKIKASKRLNALIQMNPGDRFGRAYKLRAVEASGPKGDYWTYDIQPQGYVTKDVYDRAASIYNAIKGGERKVDYGVAEPDAEEGHVSPRI